MTSSSACLPLLDNAVCVGAESGDGPIRTLIGGRAGRNEIVTRCPGIEEFPGEGGDEDSCCSASSPARTACPAAASWLSLKEGGGGAG